MLPHMPEDRLRVLAGRYQLRARLGEGGMGVVWQAWDPRLHQAVAIKEVTLPAHLPAGERERRLRRTLREARMAAALRTHPGIVPVYDVVEEDGRPWIIMELVGGPSLAEVIKAEGRLPEPRAARIARQVITALVAAEAAGIVHRDVKPANILLKGDQAMLTDFGISAMSHDTSDLTVPGQLVGTPAYLAPEQIEGEGASAASDLWAVGVTLYQAVEGRRPFERDSTPALVAAIISRPPAPYQHADRLRPVLDGLLVKDPAGRLTADQALALLVPVSAGTGGALRTRGRSRRARAAVAAGSLLGAAAVTAGVVWGVQQAGSPDDAGGSTASPAPSGQASTPVAGATGPTGSGPARPPAQTSVPPPSGDAAASGSAAPLPRGFSLRHEERGFSIAVPDGWTREESDKTINWERPSTSILSPSSWALIAFADPEWKETRSPAVLLDILRDTFQKDGNLVSPGSYRELSRRPFSYPGGRGAELEYRFSPTGPLSGSYRLYSRCVVRHSGGVGMFWFFAPEGEWAQAGTHVDTFIDTFRID
jgi:hypothetical protein